MSLRPPTAMLDVNKWSRFDNSDWPKFDVQNEARVNYIPAFKHTYILILTYIADLLDGWVLFHIYALVFVCAPELTGTPADSDIYLVVCNL